MNIEKLKSGSYRIRMMYKGKTYSVTVDHKPDPKEATKLINDEMQRFQPKQNGHKTFEEYFHQYIEDRSNLISPTTISGYNTIARNMPRWFFEMRTEDITQDPVTRMVNEYSKNHSPKSTRNLHGLVCSVLKMARPDVVLNTKLPAKVEEDVYIPSDDEMKRILAEAKGTKFEVPLYLAVFGMRRSEICALTIDDLEGNFLYINKAKVQTTEGEWVVKETTKTESSTRRVFITDYVRDLILKQGYIFKGNPEIIRRYLVNTEDRLGIQHFSLHKLRHYFASMTHDMGISDADIMAMGGWKTDRIMKAVYRHSVANSVSEGQQMYAAKIAAMNMN